MRLRPLFCGVLFACLITGPASAKNFEHMTVAMDKWVWSIAFSPDSSTFVTAGSSAKMALWSTSTGKLIRQFGNHKAGLRSVTFSSDGTTIVAAGADKAVTFWNVKDGSLVRTIQDTQDAYCPSLSRDGQTLLVSSAGNEPTIWDVTTSVMRRRLTGHNDIAWVAALSPDGTIAATGSVDKTVKLWKMGTGQCIKTLTGHTASVTGLAFSADGKSLVSCGSDGTARIWDIQTGTEKMILWAHRGTVREAAFSPDGNALATTGDDNQVKIWDLRSGEMAKAIRAGNRCITFSPDGKYLVAGAASGHVTLWNWKDMWKVAGSGKGRHDLRPEWIKLGIATPRNQNPRGTCAFFTTADLMAFALAKKTGKGELLSVDYLLWARSHSPRGPLDVKQAFDKYGVCAERLMPYVNTSDDIREPSDEAKRDAEEKRKIGLSLRFLDDPALLIVRPADGYVPDIKKTLDQGIPVGSYSHHCVILVGYIDDPSWEGGGIFIGRDSAAQAYQSLPYAYTRTHTGGFPVWE